MCERCGRKDGLEVHHLDNTYEIIGEELQHLNWLEVLCSECHEQEHAAGAGA